MFRKIGKYDLCSEGKKKRAFSLQLSVFGKWSFFVPIQSHQTLQKSGFQQAQGKTQNDTFGFKSAILGRGPRKGALLLSVIPKSCALLKTLFCSVFSKHSFADMKECNLKKNKNLPRIEVVCQNAKWCLFGLFFVLVVLFFFCVFVLL